MAARKVGSSASDSGGYPLAGVNPLPGRMLRAASSEPSTPTVAAASTVAVTTAALVTKTMPRCGVAAKVVWIIPVPYSLVIASTASTTTAICPSQTPVRLSLVVSSKQVVGVGHWDVSTDAVARVLTATVNATAASSNQAVLDTVRSFVHSARSARLMRRAGGAARTP